MSDRHELPIDTTEVNTAIDAYARPAAARSPITGWWHADSGSGVTRAAIQNAIDAASQSQIQTGQGGTVYIPDPPAGQSWMIDGTINVRSRVTIRGNNRVKTVVLSGSSIDQAASYPTLIGPGSVPLFQIGAGYPTGMDSLAGTDTVLDGISARNANAPVVRNWSGLNFRIVNSELRSLYDAVAATNRTVELRYAYRGVIEQSVIACVRGWAIDARDNINGVAIRDNIISGGSLGGAIMLALATSCTIENNVIESSQDGIALAPVGPAPSPTESNPSGICSAIQIRGNYLEDCQRYITLGAGMECRGTTVTGNYMGGGTSRSFTVEYGILAGRLVACEIKSNSWFGVDGAPFLKVAYVAGGTITAPVQCEIGPNHLAVVRDAQVIYDTSGYPNVAQQCAFTGRNAVWTTLTGTTPIISGQREWTSGILAANVATVPAIALQTTTSAGWGASLIGVEIIGASGTLTGAKVQLGWSGGANAFADIAIDTLTYTSGAASVDLSTVFTRADTTAPMLLRVVAGTGTGTFQVRVKWRGA